MEGRQSRTVVLAQNGVPVTNRRMRGDRGATLVEAAIVTPLLLLFIFGIFEFGLAFRDYLTVANSARDGVRTASVAGVELDADYRTLMAIADAAAILPDDAIEEIVIFKATGPNDTPAANCESAGTCNRYVASDLQRPAEEFGCHTSTIAPNAPDRHWCPNTREVSVGTGLDFIGVQVLVNHEYVTGLFGADVALEDQLILKVEPQEN